MDGEFVPNFTYGPPLIRSLRPSTSLIFDTHLMMAHPEKYLDDFLAAGCDIITIHLEAIAQPGDLLQKIRSEGALAGLAGALEATGPLGQLTPYVPVGYGFAAIIVAYVGRLHPVGVVFAGILMSMFYIGGELAQSRLGLPKSLTGVFQGLLLFALLACDTMINYRVRWLHAPLAAPEPRALESEGHL